MEFFKDKYNNIIMVLLKRGMKTNYFIENLVVVNNNGDGDKNDDNFVDNNYGDGDNEEGGQSIKNKQNTRQKQKRCWRRRKKETGRECCFGRYEEQ